MSIPRPKILTRFTVPSGGWDLKVYSSTSSDYDTSFTATIPAGDYYVGWDDQDDDFLYALCSQIWTDGSNNYYPILNLTSTGKTFFQVIHANQPVKVAWTELDGDEVANVLGFDSSSDATDIEHGVTSTWQHAYGWYANEDGLLVMDYAEDIDHPMAPQSVAPATGHAKTHYVGSHYRNILKLQHVARARMWSGQTGYTETSVHPYEKNTPLECWWRLARTGRPFRVYRDGRINAASTAADRGLVTLTNIDGSTFQDTSKAWDIDPQRWKGRLFSFVPDEFIHTGGISVTEMHKRWYISSHDADTLTFANSEPYNDQHDDGDYYILDQPYQTYWVDLNKMDKFHPKELPHIDRYNIDIPLLRYQS